MYFDFLREEISFCQRAVRCGFRRVVYKKLNGPKSVALAARLFYSGRRKTDMENRCLYMALPETTGRSEQRLG